MDASPLSLGSLSFRSRYLQALAKILCKPLAHAFGLSDAERLYEEARRRLGRTMSAEALIPELHKILGTTIECNQDGLAGIPRTGPLVVVANHPFGGIEATVLFEIIRSVRPDVKFMANHLLHRFEAARDVCIFVNPFESKSAAATNIGPLREAIRWLHRGHVLCVFPAGAVSHFQWKTKDVRDPAWSTSIAQIIRKGKAPVVPVHFAGNNGLIFQVAGAIHPVLRTALLVREFCNKRTMTVQAKIGRVVSQRRLSEIQTDTEMTAFLRTRTYVLGCARSTAQLEAKQPRALRKICPPVSPRSLCRDISALPPGQRLVQAGEHRVYFARAAQIPAVLNEIGRLREIAFRAVGEGTGASLDLDAFDSYYTHLFVWNKERCEVVSAYRLMKTDRAVRRLGIGGLYTSTLFEYSPKLLDELGPCLELGRSFVRPEYQKCYSSLYLLWRGICEYVRRNPRYRTLFGPVSISDEYNVVSRSIILEYLRAHKFFPRAEKLVRPRNPLRAPKLSGIEFSPEGNTAHDWDEVSELLREVQGSRRGIPILLRQYVRLGGRFFGFTVDSRFGNTLDGLVAVDLLNTDRTILDRYMTPEGAQEFLATHSQTRLVAA